MSHQVTLTFAEPVSRRDLARACQRLGLRLVRPPKTWLQSEKQGRGRRYWFANSIQAGYFAGEKAQAGYIPVWDGGLTVWVSFGKKMTEDVRKQRAGIDTLG